MSNSVNGKLSHKELIFQSPLFDEKFYRKNAKLLPFQNAVSHYLKYGFRNKLSPSEHFASEYYILAHNDVKTSKANPLLHYLMYGWQEKRKPNPSFDSAAYIRDHLDVSFSDKIPVEHCVETYGHAKWPAVQQIGQSTTISNWMDDDLNIPVEPLKGKNRKILLKLFDEDYYTSHYNDIDFSNIDPFHHFESWGWRENCNPCAGFDTAYYRIMWNQT